MQSWSRTKGYDANAGSIHGNVGSYVWVSVGAEHVCVSGLSDVRRSLISTPALGSLCERALFWLKVQGHALTIHVHFQVDRHGDPHRGQEH